MKKNGQNSGAELTRARAKKKRVSVLGATGTIGQHNLRPACASPGSFSGGGAHSSSQCREKSWLGLAIALKAEYAAIADERLADEVAHAPRGNGNRVRRRKRGAGGGGRPARRSRLWPRLSGQPASRPQLAALHQGTTVGSREQGMPCFRGRILHERAGALRARRSFRWDSEHSAVFQSLDDLECLACRGRCGSPRRAGLFAPGQPSKSLRARPEDALKHPNWTMGQKITIDSATMMNKGLELIEAFHLFNVDADQLSAVIHPQSIIHALVYYSDGSVIAQASLPDMRTPIAYSLAWPHRLQADFKRLDLTAAGDLTFDKARPGPFSILFRLAKDSLKAGGAAPTILNAANERCAVEAFLNRSTSFPGIAALVERTLNKAASELSGVLPDSLGSGHVSRQARSGDREERSCRSI